MGISTPNTIVERINRQAVNVGLNQTEIAEAAGIPRETYRRRLARPDTFLLGEIDRIGDVLGFDPYSGDTDEETCVEPMNGAA